VVGMPTLHHVNLGVPTGGEQAEGEFLVDVLGFRRVQAGPDVRAMAGEPMWYEGDDGGQIHLSVDPDHRPAARAHVAVEVGDSLAKVRSWLEGSGRKFAEAEADGRQILVTRDPAGNRWELRGTPAAQAG
jgi:catechol 2,3-dioxygenase-like lactoylglutathione lyase family enzyme